VINPARTPWPITSVMKTATAVSDRRLTVKNSR
jgi:hypothetical protein